MAPEQNPEQRETREMQIPASFADGRLMISFEDFAKIFGLKWVYQDEMQNAFSGRYTFEVWGEEKASGSSSINMLDSGELYLTNGGIQTLVLTEYHNARYLLTARSMIIMAMLGENSE